MQPVDFRLRAPDRCVGTQPYRNIESFVCRLKRDLTSQNAAARYNYLFNAHIHASYRYSVPMNISYPPEREMSTNAWYTVMLTATEMYTQEKNI